MPARTEQAIIDAFNRLIAKYPFEKITVDAIVTEAGISRSTFYRYFKDKYDVMNANYKVLIDYYVSPSRCHNYRKMFFYLFSTFQERWKTLGRIFSSTGINSFSNYVAKYSYQTALAITKDNRNGEGFTPAEDMQCEAFCCALSRIFEQWLSGKYNLTADEIADALFAIAPPTVRDYWWVN